MSERRLSPALLPLLGGAALQAVAMLFFSGQASGPAALLYGYAVSAYGYCLFADIRRDTTIPLHFCMATLVLALGISGIMPFPSMGLEETPPAPKPAAKQHADCPKLNSLLFPCDTFAAL
ncbi:hypothetical protein [Paludibacterium paludis]|uniref:Uncharacterized protein n=1 Tax=Paludibacterium paludis TaxID=1225769 RepID=A0A918UCB0_9NEIS|nr:hypothetical protein [Paludibacterium paludis]GGY29766.1 hypothetical protein GCM10011289_35840 [Paludibacterium paludis]